MKAVIQARRKTKVTCSEKKLTQDLYPSHPLDHLRLSYQRGIINCLLQKLLSALLPEEKFNQSDLPKICSCVAEL